ncbi:MAG: Nudix family hydrolase [Gammaproteobacteria bacterium]|nr:MAG: Nudix family hydrolase [Gammaproteobacteria bacterium]
MPNTEADSTVAVAVGVLIDERHRVLVARRAAESHQGGLWEFPGGKVERGETAYQALCREFQEEIGITITTASQFLKAKHAYADKIVELDVWRIESYSGNAHGNEGQDIKWVNIDSLHALAFPKANRRIINTLQLPNVYGISSASRYGTQNFLKRLQAKLDEGLALLQIREPGLSEIEVLSLAEQAVKLCHPYNARVLLNGYLECIEDLGADGVHLSMKAARQLTSRPLTDQRLVAVSCHNKQEMDVAYRLDADFAVLSPVLPTNSHPGAPTLGWDTFMELSRSVPVPVYALGGMKQEHIIQAQKLGGLGVAMLGQLWENSLHTS